MSMTTEQIKKLKDEADLVECTHDYTAKLLREAADTIKVQSAKIHAYAMERSSAYYNGGWINVNDRLPTEPYPCLVTVWDTCVKTQEEFENILPYFVGYDGETWNDADGNICPFEVIAWMPLPEPYREDGDTE